MSEYEYDTREVIRKMSKGERRRDFWELKKRFSDPSYQAERDALDYGSFTEQDWKREREHAEAYNRYLLYQEEGISGHAWGGGGAYGSIPEPLNTIGGAVLIVALVFGVYQCSKSVSSSECKEWAEEYTAKEVRDWERSEGERMPKSRRDTLYDANLRMCLRNKGL